MKLWKFWNDYVDNGFKVKDHFHITRKYRGSAYVGNDFKVRDHFQITGKYRGYAYRDSNTNLKLNRY